MTLRVCLDAGHYGSNYNAGAVKGYYESNMTWDITNYQKQYLEEYEGVTVILTRSDKAKDLALYDRGYMAKGCDLFISNHSNASSTESADYPVVIRAYDNKNNAEVLGLKLAKIVEEVMNTKQTGRTWTRVGSTGANEYYGVLRGARSAGLSHYYIIEHSFHTNKNACTFLMSQDNLKKMAKAEVEVIASHYGLKKKSTATNTSTSTNYVVRVTTDVLRVRKNAGTEFDIATRVYKGEAFTIVEEKKDSAGSLWGKLKSGAGWISLEYTEKIK